MTRTIGGFSLEGRYFIVRVPEDWKETDPLPAVSPDDLWFDRVTDFKAALHGSWIRKPVRRSPWTDTPPIATPLDPVYAVEEYRVDLTESAGDRAEIAAQPAVSGYGPQAVD